MSGGPIAVTTRPPLITYGGQGGGTFLFVRHGATEHNLRGLRCGGDLDIELSEFGREQSRRAAERLRSMNVRIGLIVASGLARARESARIMSGVLGEVPITVEPLFNERRLGEWNSRPIAETEPRLVRNVTPPGGESELVFLSRIAAALERLLPHLAHAPVLVGSSGVARVLNVLLGGEGRLSLANGEIVQFALDATLFPLKVGGKSPN